MRIIKAYHKLFCFESPFSTEEVKLRLNMGANAQAEWIKDPGLFNIFDSRGKILLHVMETDSGSKLKLRMVPYLFRHKGTILFMIISILIWALLIWLLPLSIAFAIVAVFYWLFASFIAIYILLAIMFSASLYLLITATPVSLGYMVASWITTLLIVHLILAFNQRGLKNFMMARLQNIEKKLC